jgi:predicted transcriptional regulator
MDNSKSLFRDMIQTALDQDLNKTELQVFLVLLNQTLGFGKASDPLTYGRIAKSIHKRKDHAKNAIKNVLKAGLFDAQKHPYFNFTYTIGIQFLLNHRGDFFTPTLPKTGEGLRKMETFTKNWEHTDLYLYTPLSLQPQTNPTKSDCAKNKQNKSRLCGGCCGCYSKKSRDIKQSAAPTPQPESQPTEIATTTTPSKENSVQEAVPPAIATLTTPAKAHSAQTAVQQSHPEKTPNSSIRPSATTINPLQGNTKQTDALQKEDKPLFDWSKVKLPTLPESIRPENHAFIYTLFKQGTPQEAKNALAAYENMQKNSLIRSPTGLLRRLSEWSQNNTLSLPDKVESSPENDPRHIPLHPSHKAYNADPLADLSPEERIHYQRKEDKAYLIHVAKIEHKSLAETAKLMNMQHILPHLDNIDAKPLSSNSDSHTPQTRHAIDNTTFPKQNSLSAMLEYIRSEHPASG